MNARRTVFILLNETKVSATGHNRGTEDKISATGPAPVCSIMMTTKDEESALPSRRCGNHGKVCEGLIEGPFVRTLRESKEMAKE